MNVVQGSCFCTSVQYEFVLPVKFVVNCHCTECQRLNAAAFVTWVGSWDNKLTIVSGAECLSTYAYEDEENTSRQFCRKCGTQLFFRCSRWAGEVHVTRATVFSDNVPDIQADVFYTDKASWCDLRAQLPKYGGKTGTQKLTENLDEVIS